MKYLVLIACLFSTLSLAAQGVSTAWEGTWKGDVEIWQANERVDVFPMSLEISRQDTFWNFIIHYQKDPEQPDLRSYRLITIDSTTGHYAIDEQNSIILDTYLLANCLFTDFSGMGNTLLTRICQSGGTLEYEISSSQAEPVRISGDTTIEGNTIPEIRSYSVFSLMKARLHRDKEK